MEKLHLTPGLMEKLERSLEELGYIWAKSGFLQQWLSVGSGLLDCREGAKVMLNQWQRKVKSGRWSLHSLEETLRGGPLGAKYLLLTAAHPRFLKAVKVLASHSDPTPCPLTSFFPTF